MPEVPDLEAIRTFFNHRIVGETVERVDPVIPFIVRVPRDEFVTALTGDTFGEVHRFGKFLLFSLASGKVLVVNPMLTGRFTYIPTKERRKGRTALVLTLGNGEDIRYAVDLATRYYPNSHLGDCSVREDIHHAFIVMRSALKGGQPIQAAIGTLELDAYRYADC